MWIHLIISWGGRLYILMIVYLDQNKWIELARVANGLDKSSRAKQLYRDLIAAIDCGYIFPLSAIHIMEFSRIKNHGRRSRLGRVMWDFSQGITTPPLKEILCWEIEIAFANLGYDVKPRYFKYLGKGIPHAFGEEVDSSLASMFAEGMDEAMLCGFKEIPPVQGAPMQQRKTFASHLRSLNERKHELERVKWKNWLYAISMMDITEPLYEVMSTNRIPNSDIEGWGEKGLMEFMDSMPTRRLDVHLHRQVLKNPEYKAKLSDLEDWAGLGTAMCYADVVICEKHFANLVSRDRFVTKAKVKTSIYDLFKIVG